MDGSPKASYSLSDLWPTIKLFLLMILPIILEAVTSWLLKQDFGQFSELIQGVWAAVVAFAAKWLSDTRKVK